MPLQATSGAASYDAFGGGAAAEPNYIESVFQTYLYTGNGTTGQSINNGIDLTEGGLVVFKNRADASWDWIDTERGGNNSLRSNSTGAQYVGSSTEGVTAFNSNGFTLGANIYSCNGTSQSIASWTFRRQPKFFDVVTYTGNGTNNRTITHALTSTPGCILVKRTDSTGDWYVYHRGVDPTLAYGYFMVLNTTAARAGAPAVWDGAPTSTTFTIQDATTNINGATYVAYIFAHDAGGFGLTGTDNVISCGSYTGNGSSTGPEVNIGYEPQWLLIKEATQSGNAWSLFDNMRGLSVAGPSGHLRPNASDAEDTTSVDVRPTATGFQPISSSGRVNRSGETFIYIAIRRGPMKVPTSGTSVYKGYTYTANGTTGRILTSASAPNADAVFQFNRAGGCAVVDRLRGFKSELPTYSTDSESASSYGITSINDTSIIQNAAGGFYVSWNFGSNNYVTQTFARAPSFFDEVCYTGTGSARTITHNLAAVPELMIVKCRSTARAWPVYAAPLGNTEEPRLNESSASGSSTSWNSTTPTSSVFSVSNGSIVNASGDTYVAYLFATCAGVSKVGSYTGTATTLQVDCGFTGGARFVLIKRTDSTGDWYVWDSARGIVAGNDPYLLLNTTAAEVTSTDYVDTYSAGFEISSTAPAAINASGGTFVFLAIA